MNLKDLSTEEIKEIMTKLLYKTEPSKEIVDKNIKFRKVYVYNGKYCINYDDGFDYKICSIDNLNASISSESINDNVWLTQYYLKLLNETFQKKTQQAASI